jgi:hypothetical protein
MPSLVIAQGSWLCDSSSSNWFMRRSSVRTAWVSLLHWRRPRVFSTNRLMSQVPVLQVLRAKFIECLYCYHLSMSGWNLTERAIQSNRELGEWLPSEAACPGTVHYWFQKSCHSKDIICPVVCRFIWATYQVIEILQAKNGAHEAVPKCGYMCIWNQGLSKTEQERCLESSGSSALISFEMKSVLA